jgi:hypothetical protein
MNALANLLSACFMQKPRRVAGRREVLAHQPVSVALVTQALARPLRERFIASSIGA